MCLFSLVLCALFIAGCSSVVTHELSKPEEVHQNAWDFAVLVNEYRAEKGLPALEWDTDLWRIANLHNADMSDLSYFSHFNPNGESPFDRLRNIYIMYYTAGENLAFGQISPQTVLCNWLASPHHRRNIESSLYTHHAVDYDSTDHHWTHLFVNYGGEKPFPIWEDWTLYPRIPPEE